MENKMDFSKLAKGFYPVKEDGAWDLMYFDGDDFYDFISGQYGACDHRLSITEVGEKIELPSN
jgi:hypothetical protein